MNINILNKEGRKKKSRFALNLLILLVATLTLGSCQKQTREFQIQGIALGTYYSITYTSTSEDKSLPDQVDSVLKMIDETYSIFNKGSIVSKFNRNEPVKISDELLNLTRESLKISQMTDGAFDITAGPLIRQAGFAAEARGQLDSNTLDSLRAFVSFEKLTVSPQEIVKADPRMQLDFNAIAKGRAVDCVARLLWEKGITGYVVDIGGEVVAHGRKSGDRPWIIGIQIPTETKDGLVESDYAFEANGLAVATSGNYRNYIEEEGRRFSHIINPKTGKSESSDLLSVTVVCKSDGRSGCATADAYATAFMVMGREAAMEFLDHGKGRDGIAAHFIYYDRSNYKHQQTENFPKNSAQ